MSCLVCVAYVYNFYRLYSKHIKSKSIHFSVSVNIPISKSVSFQNRLRGGRNPKHTNTMRTHQIALDVDCKPKALINLSISQI